MFEDFYLDIELLDKNAKMPTRAYSSDAGCDVYAPEKVTIFPGRDALIPLGWRCKFPEGYALVFFNKSGVSTKKKLDIGACCIDSQYRGIVHVHLFNTGERPVTLEKGDKIAQFLVFPVWTGVPFEKKVEIDSERGEDGFGSTDKK